jgi:hypothetical protein
MYLGYFENKTRYKRKSKLGKEHYYTRIQRYVNLKCDACGEEFTRPRRKMNPTRLNNNYFHVCDNCDAKRFAQKRGVEKRKIWQLTASSELPVSKF